MRTRTPIDIYRSENAKSIYIKISRNFNIDSEYSIEVKGIDNEINIKSLPRDACYRLIKIINDRHINHNIIYKNEDTETIIKNWMLYKIYSIENAERTRDNMIRASKRDIQKFGITPTQSIKGFKRPNPKTMPPVEKTW